VKLYSLTIAELIRTSPKPTTPLGDALKAAAEKKK